MKDGFFHVADILNEETDLFFVNFSIKIYLVDCKHGEDVVEDRLQLIVVDLGENVNWIEAYLIMFEIDQVILVGEMQRDPLRKLLHLYASEEFVAGFCQLYFQVAVVHEGLVLHLLMFDSHFIILIFHRHRRKWLIPDLLQSPINILIKFTMWGTRFKRLFSWEKDIEIKIDPKSDVNRLMK
jgi:hypothetical protein